MDSNKHFLPANILLPKTNFEKWSVIACDQFTSQPEYWQNVEKITNGYPSSLNIIFPECKLGNNNDKKIKFINDTMNKYLNSGIFNEYKDTFVYVERKEACGKIRKGIVGVIDLEDYDYRKNSNSLIRATEETVEERIPPRVKIRIDAPIEIPHVMLLADDVKKELIEPLSEMKNNFQVLYDFDLMLGSGHITGYALNDIAKKLVDNKINNLSGNNSDLLFAVGDGNHSLASAKECYRLRPTSKNRYALAEVVNIHDEAITFEPIYRVIFNCNAKQLIADFISYCGGEYSGKDAQVFTCYHSNNKQVVSVKSDFKLCVATLQNFLDNYIIKNNNITIDFIHGKDAVRELSKKDNTLGFIFNGMKKEELFSSVKHDGSLPRKTFSMGEAIDKRFYMECRLIK